MTDQQVVLITGVAGYWGSRVATRLLTGTDYAVIGIDARPLPNEIPGLNFIQADFRDPLLADLMAVEEVHTVCHLAFWETGRRSEAAFEHNVMGTMKFFGSCAAANVKKIILKSSAVVYGAQPDNPAYLTEDAPLRGSRRYGYNRYQLETEDFCNGFRRQNPAIQLTVLRFANIVGPTADTPFTRYLGHQSTPVLMGFNPMMQVIHEDDVVSALVHAVIQDVDGTFNVAAQPAMPLKRILSLAGTLPISILHPLTYSSALNPMQRKMSLEPDYLRYRWTMDTTAMSDTLGFYPEQPADEAVKAFRQQKRLLRQADNPPPKARPETDLLTLIERRRKVKAQQARTNTQVTAMPFMAEVASKNEPAPAGTEEVENV